MPLYRRLPQRGFSNSLFKREYTVVNVGTLEKKYSDGETVSLDTLLEKRIVKGKTLSVKILGEGELTKKLTVEIANVSAQARTKIENAGGTVMGGLTGGEEEPEGSETAPAETDESEEK